MYPDYVYEATLAVGCEGPAPGLVRSSPAGSRRSRDGAQLQCVLADARHWYKGSDNRPEPSSTYGILLENPTRAQVFSGLIQCGEFLNQFKAREDWNGGTLNFTFCGHGSQGGELVLADGELSPDELIEQIDALISSTAPKRKARFVFDCCFSGLTLARIMVHPLHGPRISIPDAFAAALHDELAWELDSLGHGALTFTLRYPGNQHVDQSRLARSVEEGDDAYLRLALQGFVPNPVTYLTEGDQHSLELTNGHLLDVKGGAQLMFYVTCRYSTLSMHLTT
jgi:hypothetical protein